MDPIRTGPDACPGTLQLHQAADGPLARVRVPGGELPVAALRALATDLGDGSIELTSRANIQVRALRDPTAFATRIAAAGLLPSPTHERVRNILASPLTGLGPHGTLDIRPLLTALDHGLCAHAPLAALPGRFLFALDDGTGDVAALGADVTALPVPGSIAILLAGIDHGFRCSAESAVQLMLAAAECFLAERTAQNSQAWRLAELQDGPARIAARLASNQTSAPEVDPSPGDRNSPETAGPPPVGVVSLRDGTYAIGVAVPLGRLSAGQVEALARVAGPGGVVRLTPWRGVVVVGLSAEAVAAAEVTLGNAGLVSDPRSPWVGITACTGRPGCAKSLTDVRADARASVAGASELRPVSWAVGRVGADPDRQPEGRVEQAGGSRPVHWAGCERRCGRPRGEVVDVVAVPEGYRVEFEGVSRTYRELDAVVGDVRSRRLW
ncbi:precorrin-3B synthase [Acrocarpospora corrugata]|uniref:Precorrin-3B synthase n=1 Tax=Acrocarpospora corrugata TaxID=35763 RepID=A0A5M3WC67_9ACTN|nr:precorrin-3B synthase [Acrocarpospora corrugata]GES04038.1 precorrin-3B synthase [Acrocarpospora corrugata]